MLNFEKLHKKKYNDLLDNENSLLRKDLSQFSLIMLRVHFFASCTEKYV